MMSIWNCKVQALEMSHPSVNEAQARPIHSRYTDNSEKIAYLWDMISFGWSMWRQELADWWNTTERQLIFIGSWKFYSCIACLSNHKLLWLNVTDSRKDVYGGHTHDFTWFSFSYYQIGHRPLEILNDPNEGAP